jgi:SNF2 family DNA or RNA helicase
MTKEECMSKELSPRKREVVSVPIPSRHELRYTQALKDLAEAFSSSRTNCGGENDDTLSSFHRLRQISAIAKVDAIVSLSNSILIKESSIVIFTSFVAVAKEIYHKLEDMDWAGELLTGETAPKKRQAMVDRFQTCISPVFVCTYGAGGVGLTLTAACTVVLVDRPWTPGDVCQAEDRVRRIGQTRPVRSIWIRSFPIDDRIDESIDHKEVNSSAAVDGKDHGCQNRNAPKVSIAELVKSVLGNQDDRRKK